MSQLDTIAGIEIRRLYRRPLPWAILALTSLLMAVFFMLLVIRYLNEETLLGKSGVTAEILMRYFGTAFMITLVLVPLLTMTSMDGARGDRDLRFLFSLPVTTQDIVGGRLLALGSLGAAIWFVISLLPLTLLWGSPVDLGVYAGNVVGLGLFIALNLSLGLFAASLTRLPMLAGIASLFLSLVLWFADWARRLDPDATLLGGLSTASRLRGFAAGLINTADIVYFLAGTLAFAVASAWFLDSLRRNA